jgi:hypothetical protein
MFLLAVRVKAPVRGESREKNMKPGKVYCDSFELDYSL